MGLRAGDWVEVRSRDEILATLDERGRLEGLPFMPEMLAYCGRRFRIWKRAHKTCDTVNKTGGRRMHAAVHLEELRCDGAFHGGCQAGCLLYWKEAWLKPLGAGADAAGAQRPSRARCTVADLERATIAEGSQRDADPTYACQATVLPYVTTPLHWWDPRQYWEDYRSGNVTLVRMASSFCYVVFLAVSNIGVGGRTMRRFYDAFARWRGGVPFPKGTGTIPKGESTPVRVLDLQPGERVRVRTHREILATLDTSCRNRGLYFDCEEVPFCGGTYVVKSRVTHFIDERSGRMSQMKTPAVILDGVYCQARYSDRRLFCPRAIYPLWREIWLERVDDAKGPEASRELEDRT
jgi:hypothetical protein